MENSRLKEYCELADTSKHWPSLRRALGVALQDIAYKQSILEFLFENEGPEYLCVTATDLVSFYSLESVEMFLADKDRTQWKVFCKVAV